MNAVGKSILTAVIAGGVLIAAFYVAYLFLLLIVLGGVGGIAYLWFNRDKGDLFDRDNIID